MPGGGGTARDWLWGWGGPADPQRASAGHRDRGGAHAVIDPSRIEEVADPARADEEPTPTPSPTPTSPPPVQVASRADLELIDPWSITPTAPEDDGTGDVDSVVHLGPSGAVVHAAPGRDVIGLLPGITLMDDTAIPVTDQDGDWLRVMLPSRLSLPSQDGAVNGATGWIHVSDVAEVTPSTHAVVVDLVAHTVTVTGPDGTVTVPTRHGAAESPTPPGRTYLASRWTEESSTPAVAALGAHSPTLDAFGDGPAVVAIHAYIGETTQGVGSNGCIRLHPDDWVRAGMEALPIGTPVSIVGST